MRNLLTIAATLALLLASASSAEAKQCRDAKGKFIKCPPAAAAPAARCKNAKTKKFQKCGTPGAVPA